MTRVGDATLYTGDVLSVLAGLPEESVNCVVTSPPYWGLRDYGTGQWEGGSAECDHRRIVKESTEHEKREGFADPFRNGSASANHREEPAGRDCPRCGARRIDAQIGLEATPEEYVAKMVEVFRAVRRVLRKDGTCWINLGDSYVGGGRGGIEGVGHGSLEEGRYQGGQRIGKPTGRIDGLKAKDLVGIPWRVAFALQADGWYLRSACPWIKRNPMPESVTDRPATAVEYMFLFSKSARYFWDAEAIKSEASKATNARISQNLAEQVGSFRANGGNKTNGPMRAVMAGTTRKISEAGSGIAANRSFQASLALPVEKRNRRNADWFMESWQGLLTDEEGDPLAFIVNPLGYKEAHFATFPRKLVQPCILAGCPEHACPKCGAPWVKEVEKSGGLIGKSWHPHAACTCGLPAIGGTVLDPFGGSGTVAEVALEYGRRAILIELKPEYVELQKRRLAPVAGRPMLDFTSPHCGASRGER